MSKILEPESFFRKPTPKQLAQISASEFILETFCRETSEAQTNKKLVLTDAEIVILELLHGQYCPVLVCQLTDQLRFQRLPAFPNLQTQRYGFQLLNQQNQSTTLYLQFPSIQELWLKYLSKVLIETGFQSQYEVLSKIGSGSSATVCSVRRLRDGKLFAAKVFPKSSFAEKPEKRESVMNEIQVLRALDHPNIIKIVSVMQSQASLFMITENLSGGNLFERINRERGINEQQSKQVMRGLLKALACMHGYGVMHRDIKLQNVMLRSAESWQPVLIDFGLAAISDEEPYFFYRCGTPGYIAPQIIGMRQKQHIDVVCDIFSAGALLHILLTSCYLFQGANNDQVYKANKALNFDLSSQKYAKLDQQAVELMRAMLEVDPEERIGAEECLEMEYLAEEGIFEKCEVSPAATQIGGEAHFQF